MALTTYTAGDVLTAASLNANFATTATFFAKGQRTTDLTLTSSSLDTLVDTTNFSATVTASAGDLLQATWQSFVTTGTNIANFNFGTFNATPTLINRFYAPTTFNPFFFNAAESGYASFTALYECVAGDIVSGAVTVKLMAQTGGAARQVAFGSIAATFTLANLGQVQ